MQQAYFLPNALAAGRQLLLAGLLLAAAPAAHAQLAHGSANAQNVAGTFTDLGTTGTAIATVNNDDANSTAQNIGFTFNYNGASFTQFVLNTNGLIRLGSVAPSAANMFAVYEAGMQSGIAPIESNDAANTNLLIPFNADLEAAATGTEYRVATTGTAPNQVCTIQWKNVSDKAGSAANGTPKQYASFTFQVKLYQTTNVIEFVYGPATGGVVSADDFRYPTVGIKGSGNGGGQTVLANKEDSSSAWSTTAFITGIYGPYTTHNFRGTVPPDAGRTYRFTPCSPLVISSFPYTENFDALAAKQSLYNDIDYGPIPTDLTSPLPCGATSLDANADNNSWFVIADNSDYASANTAPNALAYAFNLDGSTAANDWYFTPGLSLRAGYKYQLQFKYLVGDDDYPESLEVKYGTAATPAAQTNTLFSNNAISNSTAYITTTAANVATITPTANGIYYIGFHATSVADQYLLFLDDMQVTETAVLAVRNATNSVFTAEASPVPFGESLNLTINTLKPGPAHLILRDALGRTVRQSTTASLVGASTVAVPGVSNLPAGVYFLTVEQGGASQLLRVAHQ
jgi:hypothetical protein